MTEIRITEEMGRGVFATQDFQKDQVVAICDVIVIPKLEEKRYTGTIMELYQFKWGKDSALALGVGSLFNHGYPHNVTYHCDRANLHMIFTSTRIIKAGEQLFINYGYDPVHYWEEYQELKSKREKKAQKKKKK